MITKNAKLALASLFSISSSGQFNYMLMTDVSGATIYIGWSNQGWPSTSFNFITSFSTSANSAGVKVGSGNAAESDLDHNLADLITAGVSGSIVLQSRTVDASGKSKIVLLVTVTNTGETDVTISEIGYFVQMKGGTTVNSTSTTNYYIMLDRTLLDTPVTIPAGNSATITYVIQGETE